jgi:AraC-like DNA-binding protein
VPLGTIFNVYKGPPKGAEYEAWREVTCRAFCGVDIQPSEGETIDCRIRIDPIGALVLAAPSGLSAQFSRTREILGDGCDDLVLVEAEWGRVPLLQGDKIIEMQGGQLCLTDMSVLGSIGHGPRGAFRTLRIPRQALLAAAPRAEDQLSIAISGHDVLRETIIRYQTLGASQAAGLDAAGQHLMAQHLVDLVALLFTSRAEGLEGPGEPGRASAQLDLIRADVLRDLGNPALVLANLVRRHGLSERQAQRLFERSGNTFTEFVLEQRLLLARKLVTDPAHRHRKISDIAHMSGFSDLSYFNRAFRKRFGVSPTEIRVG